MKRRVRGGATGKLPPIESWRDEYETDSDVGEEEKEEEVETVDENTTTTIDHLIQILEYYSTIPDIMTVAQISLNDQPTRATLEDLRRIFNNIARHDEHATPIFLAYHTRDGFAMTIIGDRNFVYSLDDALQNYNDAHRSQIFNTLREGPFNRREYAALVGGHENWNDAVIFRCQNCVDPEDLGYVRRERARANRG